MTLGLLALPYATERNYQRVWIRNSGWWPREGFGVRITT
jgi:hypothetical protein